MAKIKDELIKKQDKEIINLDLDYQYYEYQNKNGRVYKKANKGNKIL